MRGGLGAPVMVSSPCRHPKDHLLCTVVPVSVSCPSPSSRPPSPSPGVGAAAARPLRAARRSASTPSRSPVTSAPTPTVDFSGQVTDPTTTTKVLIQGDGPTVQQGDSVMIQTVIADGYTQKTVASSYKDKQPQVVTLSSKVSPIFLDALDRQEDRLAGPGLHLGRQDLRPPGQHLAGHLQQGRRPHRLRPRRQAARQARRLDQAGARLGTEGREDQGCRLRPRLQGHAEARRQAQGRRGQDRHRARRGEGSDDHRALPR